eukprot:TRINITY_DN57083_c0_g1_i1.p1 TRINITY_DN57083_c0_g1~~TRINITY_DN57083_c0_g1_i1.p1  ORF type:complete len:505 (-),score=61.54 TRINITY_DN57083_c0_g1_i1:230-1744(-)
MPAAEVEKFQPVSTVDTFCYYGIEHPRDLIVDIMSRMYDKQLTTMSGGNVSIKDSDGTIWITPGSTDKGELKRDEVVYRMEGSDVWEGMAGLKPSREWPFHVRILEERPDCKAVLHAHSQSLVAFSCANKTPDTLSLYQAFHVCGKVVMSEYRMPGAPDLADVIAKEIRTHDCVIMESHGVVICGKSLSVCYAKFEVLEFCAEAIVRASQLGGKRLLLSEEDVRYQDEVRQAELDTCVQGRNSDRPQITSKEAELRKQLVKFSKRSYETGLIVASVGAFSARLSETTFLITPMGVDRKFILPNDILLFDIADKENTKVYAEKPWLKPSVSWKMQAELFRAFPDIESITFATPRHFSAFVMTNVDFPSEIHPETYIVCQNIGRIGFRESLDHANVIDAFSKGVHALTIENKGVVIKGGSVQETFDKLEILENTTKVVLDCVALGGHKVMTKQQVKDIDKTYFGKGLARQNTRAVKDGDGHAGLLLDEDTLRDSATNGYPSKHSSV